MITQAVGWSEIPECKGRHGVTSEGDYLHQCKCFPFGEGFNLTSGQNKGWSNKPFSCIISLNSLSTVLTWRPLEQMLAISLCVLNYSYDGGILYCGGNRPKLSMRVKLAVRTHCWAACGTSGSVSLVFLLGRVILRLLDTGWIRLASGKALLVTGGYNSGDVMLIGSCCK
jgi:hypothetical protein